MKLIGTKNEVCRTDTLNYCNHSLDFCNTLETNSHAAHTVIVDFKRLSLYLVGILNRNYSYRIRRIANLTRHCLVIAMISILGGFLSADAQILDLRASVVEFEGGEKLPHVQNIVEDETGLLWIGRWTGRLIDQDVEEDFAFTYDGNRLERISPSLSKLLLPTKRLVGKSSSGKLIFSGKKVVLLNPISLEIEHEYLLKDSSLLSRYGTGNIFQVVETESGKIWAVLTYKSVPTNNKAILLKSNDQGQLEEILELESNQWRLAERLQYASGKLYFVHRDKLLFYENNSQQIDSIDIPLREGEDIQHIAVNNKGDLIIKVGHKEHGFLKLVEPKFGLFKLNTLSHELSKFDITPNTDLSLTLEVVCDADYIWLLGDGFALHRFNTKSNELVNFSKPILDLVPAYNEYTNPVYHLYKDQSGTYWMGGLTGLIRFSIIPDHLQILMGGKNKNAECNGDYCSMRGICKGEEGELYISYEDGIKKLVLENTKLTDIPFNTTATEKTGAYNISYYKGSLFWSDKIINPNTGYTKVLLPHKTSPRVVHSLDTVNGILWLMVNGDLSKFYSYQLNTSVLQTVELDLFEYDQEYFEVHNLHYDHQNNVILICSKPFLGIVDTKGKVIKDFTYVNGAQRYGGPAMYLEDSKTLWNIKNLSIGLREIEINSGQIKVHRFADSASASLLQKDVFFIQPYKDQLFLGTGEGLAIFQKPNGPLTFYEEEWITKEFEYNRSSNFINNNQLLLGTTRGLIIFDPDKSRSLFHEKSNRKLYLRSIDYEDKNMGTIALNANLINQKSITLPPDHRALSIHFSVPDYHNQQNLLYTYWLEGFESSYSKLNKKAYVNYSLLPPGNYKLHIKGGITPSLRDANEIVLNIIVRQFWYKTPLAYFFYMLVIVLLIWLGYRINLKRQQDRDQANHLKRLDEFKKEFFTNITHEFRTPLTVILGAAGELDPAMEERSIISRNGQRLLNLINDILKLSKLESGKLQLNRSQINIAAFINHLSDIYNSNAAVKQQKVLFSCNVEEFFTDIDQAKLQTALDNIMSNAFKFSPENSMIQMTVHCNSENILIEVEDEGPGIDPQDADRIFEKFYRTQQQGHVSGSGIGLATSAMLVELMGGEINYTKRTSGAVFSIKLPVSREEKLQDWQGGAISIISSEQEDRSESTEISIGDKELTVLIVEDSIDIQAHLVRCLREEYNTATASDGKEGIALAQEIIPDIIISDVMMPLMNGFELCSAIKNDIATSHIPVVMLTARADYELKIQGLEEGADAYLAKPFEKTELLLVLKNLVELRKKIQTYYLEHSPEAETPQVQSKEHAFITDLKSVLQENLDNEELDVNHISDLLHVSRMQLHRKLKALCGMSTTEFIQHYKIEAAKELLRNEEFNISEVSYRIGYSDPSYFSRIFTKHAGMSPSEYRKSLKSFD